MTSKRTEDDLRAAFALAAQDAPSADDVLAQVRAAEAAKRFAAMPSARSARRTWLPIAAVTAVVLAIAIPLGFVISHGNSNNSSASSASFAGSAPAKEAPGFGVSSAAVGGSADGAVGGPVSSPTNGANPLVVPTPPSASGSAGSLCRSTDVALRLVWSQASSGLTGTLTATNTSGTACDLAVKPAVYPRYSDGSRLDVQNVTTAEGYAGPSRLLAGATATSTVTWRSWCGPIPSDRVDVDWGAGVATLTATGPSFPACIAGTGTDSSISSTWFGPLS